MQRRARAIGPALAGMIAAATGSGAALMVSAAFFALMIVAVRSWKSHERPLPGVPETLLSGVMSGVRYMRHSIAMRTLINSAPDVHDLRRRPFGVAVVVARDQLHLGAAASALCSRASAWARGRRRLAIPGQLKVKSLIAVVATSGDPCGWWQVAGRGDRIHGAGVLPDRPRR
ncbi:MAG: MFS transporter [Betaproteobacteria bacterium]|nr:MFS transporter [Betaproteobacteria bacterium]